MAIGHPSTASLSDWRESHSWVHQQRAVSTPLPLLFRLYCALWWAGVAAAVMEFTSKKTALLVLFMMLSCLLLLLPRASSAAPLSRSLSLTRNREQPSDTALEVPAQQDEGAVGGGNTLVGEGEVAARMDIEVNDYPGSGANNRHEPRSPGRP